MHTVEMLDEAVRLAERLGYRLRHESLGGTGGGCCEIRGKKQLFVDVALGPSEQLEQVLGALRREPSTFLLPMPFPLRRLLETADG